MGVEAHLGSDLSVGVRAALADYTRRLASGPPPLEIPRLAQTPVSPAKVLDLSVNEETSAALQREAARQRTTVDELAAHSVLVYLAEVDRLTPLNAA